MDMHPEQDHACGDVLRLSEGSGTSDHQGSLFPQEKIQMELAMWGESKCSKHLSLLPSNRAHAVLCVQQDSCSWYTLCIWKLFGDGGGGGSKGGAVGLAPQYHGQLHFTELSKKPTLLKKSFRSTKVCVCSSKVCFVPALALMQGCLLFVDVNILANHFYFGVEIIP